MRARETETDRDRERQRERENNKIIKVSKYWLLITLSISGISFPLKRHILTEWM